MPTWTLPIAPAIDTRAAPRNFRITAGDVVQIIISLILSDADQAAPAGLTNPDLTFRVRRRGSCHTEFEKTIGAGITIADAAEGRIVVSIDEADTIDLCQGLYDWQLRGSASSFITVALRGTMIVDSLVEAR